MENKDKLKQVDIKNCTCYYFDDIFKDNMVLFYYMKSYMKIFHFMTFHVKLQWVQNHCVLVSIK